MTTTSNQSVLKQLFTNIDTDCDNRITRDEVYEALVEIGAPFTEDQFDNVFIRVDEHQDGFLQLPQFMQLVPLLVAQAAGPPLLPPQQPTLVGSSVVSSCSSSSEITSAVVRHPSPSQQEQSRLVSPNSNNSPQFYTEVPEGGGAFVRNPLAGRPPGRPQHTLTARGYTSSAHTQQQLHRQQQAALHTAMLLPPGTRRATEGSESPPTPKEHNHNHTNNHLGENNNGSPHSVNSSNLHNTTQPALGGPNSPPSRDIKSLLSTPVGTIGNPVSILEVIKSFHEEATAFVDMLISKDVYKLGQISYADACEVFMSFEIPLTPSQVYHLLCSGIEDLINPNPKQQPKVPPAPTFQYSMLIGNLVVLSRLVLSGELITLNGTSSSLCKKEALLSSFSPLSSTSTTTTPILSPSTASPPPSKTTPPHLSYDAPPPRGGEFVTPPKPTTYNYVSDRDGSRTTRALFQTACGGTCSHTTCGSTTANYTKPRRGSQPQTTMTGTGQRGPHIYPTILTSAKVVNNTTNNKRSNSNNNINTKPSSLRRNSPTAHTTNNLQSTTRLNRDRHATRGGGGGAAGGAGGRMRSQSATAAAGQTSASQQQHLLQRRASSNTSLSSSSACSRRNSNSTAFRAFAPISTHKHEREVVDSQSTRLMLPTASSSKKQSLLLLHPKPTRPGGPADSSIHPQSHLYCNTVNCDTGGFDLNTTVTSNDDDEHHFLRRAHQYISPQRDIERGRRRQRAAAHSPQLKMYNNTYNNTSTSPKKRPSPKKSQQLKHNHSPSKTLEKVYEKNNYLLQNELSELLQQQPLLLWKAFLDRDPMNLGYVDTNEFVAALEDVFEALEAYPEDWVIDRSVKLARLPFDPVTQRNFDWKELHSAVASVRIAYELNLLQEEDFAHVCDYKFFLSHLGIMPPVPSAAGARA